MSLPLCSKPFPAVQCLRQSFRVAAMPLPVSSSPSAPFMAIPLLVASVRFWAVPSRLFWILCHSVPSRFDSSRLPSSPCPCKAWQSYAIPYPIGTFRRRAPPCLAVSNHLRYSQRRAVSLLLYSPLSKADQIRCRSCPGASGYAQRCRFKSWNLISKLFPGFSLPFLAMPILFCSDTCASAGLVSNSARFSSCPSFSLSLSCQSWRIGSPQRLFVSPRIVTGRSFAVSSPCSTSLVKAVRIPVRSVPVPASQSPVHSTQTKPG